ncbi:MAG: hypothetical protein ACE5HA_09050 [Anaerolineae bacterium]
MLFTIASFTMSTVGTLIAVIGFITHSREKHSRLARLGWVFLFVVGASYLLGMYSLLRPGSALPGILPAGSLLRPALTVLVGAVGAFNCSYLAFGRSTRSAEGAAGAAGHPRWRGWALAGLVIIPLLTVMAAI